MSADAVQGDHVTHATQPAPQDEPQAPQGMPQGGSPEPAPNPPTRTVEFLTAPPRVMTKPLALVGGRAYAATWLWVKVTEHDMPDSKSQVAQTEVSQTQVSQREVLCIVRGDGYVFREDFQAGDTVWGGFHALKMTPKLPEKPHTSRLWSLQGVRSYQEGTRPEPGQVFERIVAIVDRFIDFERSLADQQTMCEMIACYVLSTWFLDAFNVIGYLWPNGEPGSGKTHLLAVVTELAYLGQMLLAGSSFATLRDLADYGATLAFDDAENLANPKSTDPDKRALLLAGNRRGSTVALKELSPDKKWRTRHVKTFCPRLFSATQLPDPILASRSIIVPLRRTADQAKANADPARYELWPHDRQPLIDDLWALALAHLPMLRLYEAQVNQQATLIGRNLEPWRPLLAVAKWLDNQGVAGLWERMEALSRHCQDERQELEPLDLTKLVIRALCYAIACAGSASSAGSGEGDIEWEVTTAQVRQWCEVYMLESDENFGVLSNEKVGRALGNLRFRQLPRPGGTGSRRWLIAVPELRNAAQAHNVPLPDALAVTLGDACGPNHTDLCHAHDPQEYEGQTGESSGMLSQAEEGVGEEGSSVPLPAPPSHTGSTGSSGSTGPIDWDTFDIPVAWGEIPTD